MICGYLELQPLRIILPCHRPNTMTPSFSSIASQWRLHLSLKQVRLNPISVRCTLVLENKKKKRAEQELDHRVITIVHHRKIMYSCTDVYMYMPNVVYGPPKVLDTS